MKKLIVLIAAIGLFSTADAQRDQTLFSETGLQLSGMWGGSSANFDEVDGDYEIYHGGHFALEFNKVFTVGWQGYNLSQEGLDLKMNGVQLGYGFQPYRVVHPTIKVLGSTGNAKIKDDEQNHDWVYALQPTLGLELNVFRWFRVELEGGYRFMFNTDLPGINDTDLSEPFAGVRFKFGWSWGE